MSRYLISSFRQQNNLRATRVPRQQGIRQPEDRPKKWRFSNRQCPIPITPTVAIIPNVSRRQHSNVFNLIYEVLMRRQISPTIIFDLLAA
jgi:hypothetical protein